MSKPGVPFATTLKIRDRCLCLHVQRAARRVARQFDDALRPLGLTNGQFSSLNLAQSPQPARLGSVAALLAMDRTTLTAALKPLQRRGLVDVSIDQQDRRSRSLTLTRQGRSVLAAAIPVWTRTHARVERQLRRASSPISCAGASPP